MVIGWGGMTAYPGANAAVARQDPNLLERFALQIIGDFATVAASSVALGGLVQIRYLRTVWRCILWLETGAVVGGRHFILVFLKVFERADLPSLSILKSQYLSGGDALFLR